MRTKIRTEDLYSAILVKIPRKPGHHSIFQAIQDERLRINSEEYFSRMCSVWEAFQQAADLALLATDPETRFCTSITHGFLLPQDFFKSSRKSILEGYFEDTPYNEPVFDFHCVVAILDKWANNEKRLSTGLLRYPGMILLPWMRKYFLKLLEKYLQLNGAR